MKIDKLFYRETYLGKSVNRGNESEIAIIKKIAQSDDDRPVLMLNLNKYKAEANFPDGQLYRNYMAVLGDLLPTVGGRIIWRSTSYGRPIGEQDIDEVLAAWYPSHQAFLDLSSVSGSDENFRLRKLSVKSSVIHRCDGEAFL